MEENCYQKAYQTVLKLADDSLLVHGIPTGEGEIKGVRYGHAWVEINSFVIDPFVGAVPKDDYYRKGQIDYVVRYGKEEAAKLALKHNHYGPWDEKVKEAIHK